MKQEIENLKELIKTKLQFMDIVEYNSKEWVRRKHELAGMKLG